MQLHVHKTPIFSSSVLAAANYPDPDCRSTHQKTLQDPVLLFDLDQDIGESTTLTSSDPVYTPTLSAMQTVSSLICWYSVVE